MKGVGEDESGENGEFEGRRNHTVTERLRRSEHRKLFSKLRDVLPLKNLGLPGVSKLHILSQVSSQNTFGERKMHDLMECVCYIM